MNAPSKHCRFHNFGEGLGVQATLSDQSDHFTEHFKFAAVIMLLGKLDQIRGERFSTNQKEGHVGPDLRTKIKMTARFRKSFSRRGQSKSRHSR
jgi:hypothetical protein